MAKRSGRDRNRNAARGGDHDGGGRQNRGNRKLARELGETSKLLEKARAAESKRLRQLDEAAAEVARLEGELRRIEAELAGIGRTATPASGPAPVKTPPATATTAPRAPRQAAEPRRDAPAAPPEPPAPPAEPEPAASPHDSATPSTAAAPAAPPPTVRRTRGAQPTSLEAELARLDAAREGDLRGTGPDEPTVQSEAEPAIHPAREPDAAGTSDDDEFVIRLGAGGTPMSDADVPALAPEFVPNAPVEAPVEAAEPIDEDRGWTAGAGLPFRSGRNGSPAPAEHDASDEPPSVSLESGRREAVEAPDPTARSWPQPGQQRSGS